MAICFLNKEDEKKFNRLASVVGEREAYRDFYEQGEVVRPPEHVIRKLEKRAWDLDSFQELPDPVRIEDQVKDDALLSKEFDSFINKINAQNSIDAITQMSNRLGIPFEMVSPEVSREIRQSDKDIPGFYSAGKVYFVEGLLQSDTIFHEFAHPIVKALAKDNPQLFEKLYGQIEQSFIDAVAEKYPEDTESLHFKEEVVVQKLTEVETEDISDQKTFAGKLFFAIKQFLRKLFGRKINLKNLSTKTTLRDFSKMIKGDQFILDREFLSKDDFIYQQKEYFNKLSKMDEAVVDGAARLINDMANMIDEQLAAGLREGTVYHLINEGLIEEKNNKAALQLMKKALKKLRSKEVKQDLAGKTVLEGGITSTELTAEHLANRLNIFARELSRIGNVHELLEKKLDFLSTQDINDPTTLDSVHAITQYLDQYQRFLKKAGETKAFFYQSNPLRTEVDRLRDNNDLLLIKANNFRGTIVADLLYDNFADKTEQADKFYQDQLERLKEKGSEKEYERVFLEYHGLTPKEYSELNRLEVKKKQKGRLNDATGENNQYLTLLGKKFTGFNLTRDEFKTMMLSATGARQGVFAGMGEMLNRMLESYMHNQDKVTGSFYSYIQKNMDQINANSNSRQADLLGGNKLYDLLDKAGFKNKVYLTSGGAGRELSTVINVGKYNDQTGEIDVLEEYQLKSNFRGHQPVMKELNQELKVALEEYNANPNQENEDALMKVEEDIFFFKKHFMHQEMKPEFYDNEELLYKDKVGRESRKRLQDLYDEINNIGDELEILEDIELAQARAEKFRELIAERSLYDENGNEKTGIDKDVAVRLTEYFEGRNKYFEWDTREELFHAAHTRAQEKAMADSQGNIELYEELMQKWYETHTQVAIDEEYFVQRSYYTERRKEILAPLMELNKSIVDVSQYYDKIYALSKKTRDTAGQYNGRNLTNTEQETIRDLHEELEQQRKVLYGMSGLTGEEMEEYIWLIELIDRVGSSNLSQEEYDDFMAYLERLRQGLRDFGLTEDEIKELEMIDSELRALSSPAFTTHYVDMYQKFFRDNELFREAFKDFKSIESDMDIDDQYVITQQDINMLLEYRNKDRFLNEMLSDADFGEWFLRNHYEIDRSIKEYEKNEAGERKLVDKGVKPIYRTTTPWKYSEPNNKDYFKTFELLDEDGNSAGLMKDQNGKYRIPNTMYMDRNQKEEFQTDVIQKDFVDENGNLVLATMDNKGAWLPRDYDGTKDGALTDSYIDASYKDMFKNKRGEWDLLTHIKNWHLDNQMDIGEHARLYLTLPKLRKRGVEDRFTRGYIRRKMIRIMDAFQVRDDDFELGMRKASLNNPNSLDFIERPVSGVYEDVPLTEVSTDIIDTFQRYQHSIQEHRVFNRLNSFAKSTQWAIEEWNEMEEMSDIRKASNLTAAVSTDRTEIGRAKAINAIVDEYFKGKQIATISTADNATVRKLQHGALNQVMRWSSRKWFMFNPISGLTNYASANVQSLYKLAEFRDYVNPVDLAVGHRKGFRTLTEYARKSYSAQEKSIQMQLMDILDASPDKYLKMQSEAGSRRILEDLYQLRVGYASRAFMTHEVNYAAMYAFLNNYKFRFQINGKGKKVSLDKAVEIVNGRVQTKDGVPEEYSIRYDKNGKVVFGSKLHKLMNIHKGYLNKIHGMAGRNAEGDFFNRYFIGKMISFLFKFLPGMTMDKYQFRWGWNKSLSGVNKLYTQRRFNWFTEKAEYGVFISALKSLNALMTWTGSGFQKNNFQRHHRTGLLQTLAAYFMTQLLYMMQLSIRFNPDDDDYQSEFSIGELGEMDPNIPGYLKATTSAPNLPWISDRRQWGEFDWGDFTRLQGLRLLMRIERENNTFGPKSMIPILWNSVSFQTASVGGSFKDLGDIGVQLYERINYETLEEKYARGEFDEQGEGWKMMWDPKDPTKIGQDAGPYSWQDRGDDKLLHLISRFYGLNGNLVDPARTYETEKKFTY
jgi:hypothetical protein